MEEKAHKNFQRHFEKKSISKYRIKPLYVRNLEWYWHNKKKTDQQNRTEQKKTKIYREKPSL